MCVFAMQNDVFIKRTTENCVANNRLKKNIFFLYIIQNNKIVLKQLAAVQFFALWASTELIIVIAGHFQICVRHTQSFCWSWQVWFFSSYHTTIWGCFVPSLSSLARECIYFSLSSFSQFLCLLCFMLILGQCQSNTTRVQVAHTCHTWRWACLCCYISGVVSFENQLVGWRWRQAMSNDCG